MPPRLGPLALLLLLGAAATSCRRPPAEPAPTAEGAIVFQPQALRAPDEPDTVDRTTFLATQVEILQSRGMAERVVARVELPEAEAPAGRVLSAAPRGEALILDLRAHHRDPAVAARLCNAALDEYVTQRWNLRLEPLRRKQALLADRLDALGPDGDEARRLALRHELDAVALELTGAPSDVHVLEPCRQRPLGVGY